MKILITGATGFVGRNLSAYLAERGHELLALDVVAQVPGVYAEFFSWEDLERISWAELDAVVHLAGKAHDTRNVCDAQSYFDVNVELTRQVLGACQKGVSHSGTETTDGAYCQDAKARGGAGRNISSKKFILFSSVKAVADSVSGELTEAAVPSPQTPYGRSKLAAEGLVLSAGSGSQAGLCSYILRPCMIHGPGNRGNLNLLYALVNKGLPWPLGRFENQRSFASIDNVCAVVEGLLTGAVSAGVYQVADDATFSTNQLVTLMAEMLGRRARIWCISEKLIKWLARVGDVLRLPLNSERLKKLTESYVVSNAKIKRALGWEQMPVSAESGLRKTLKSFQREHGRVLMG